MIQSLLILFGLGSFILLVIFFMTWLIQLRTKNAAIVDGVWAGCFPILALTYYLASDGYAPRQMLVLGMVMLWGLRLAFYLLKRTIGHKEDVRYTALRDEWGSNQNLFMLRFYLYQAALALVLSFPFAIMMLNKNASIEIIEWVGVALLLLSVSGEATADYQMHAFRKNKNNTGRVCAAGLWQYSRHPNYFFEWLVWVAFFITSLNSPFGVFSLFCPLAILYFLLNVTGIPYTEAQLLKSRGKAYEEYQGRTSAFIPLPPKGKLFSQKTSSQIK